MKPEIAAQVAISISMTILGILFIVAYWVNIEKEKNAKAGKNINIEAVDLQHTQNKTE